MLRRLGVTIERMNLPKSEKYDRQLLHEQSPVNRDEHRLVDPTANLLAQTMPDARLMKLRHAQPLLERLQDALLATMHSRMDEPLNNAQP